MALASRMQKELKKLAKQPPPGICAWPAQNSIRELDVQMQGPPDSPYEQGLFKLSVSVPDRYPFEPPKVQFKTPVYHPNIDAQGRICLDYLNMPPKGCWGPAMDLAKVLLAVRQLLAEPNPKDPLVVDIAEEYVSQPERFKSKARLHVAKHANPQAAAGTTAQATAIADASSRDIENRVEQQQQQQQQGGPNEEQQQQQDPHHQQQQQQQQQQRQHTHQQQQHGPGSLSMKQQQMEPS